MPELTALQREIRATTVGASEVAAVLGLSRWAGGQAIADRKLHPEDEPETTFAQRVGQVFEDGVATLAAERMGWRIRAYRRTIRHPRVPHLSATPDRGIVGLHAGLEIKTSAFGDDWGPDGDPDGVPVWYRVQVQAQMAVVRSWGSVWVAVLIGGRDLRLYEVPRNDEQIAFIEEAVPAWWQRHIVDGEPVPVDGTDEAMAAIRRRFPHEDEEERVATAEEGLVADELAAVVAQLAEADKRREVLRQRLADGMGTAAVLIGPGWRFTFRTEAGRVAWQKVADEMGAPPEVIERHRSPASRVPRFTVKRGQGERTAA